MSRKSNFGSEKTDRPRSAQEVDANSNCMEGSKLQEFQASSFFDGCSMKNLVHIMNYAKEQSKTTVSIDIEMLRIHHHPKELIEVEFNLTSLKVKAKDVGGEDHLFSVSHLAHEIVAEKSKFVIKKDKIVLILYKAKPRHWDSIYFNPPSVLSSVKKKFVDFYKTLPKRWDIQYTFQDARHHAEMLCDNGVDLLKPFSLLTNLIPPNLRSLDEIIDYMKMELMRGGSANSLAYIFTTALLAKERQIYSARLEERKAASRMSENYVNKSRSNTSEEKRKAKEMKENGNIHFKAKKFHEAIEAYSEAIALDPQCATYYLNRSIAYYNISKYASSLADAAESVELNPSYVKGHLYLAKNSLALCSPEVAICSLNKAKSIDSSNAVIEAEMQRAKALTFNVNMFIASYKANDDTGCDEYFEIISQIAKETTNVKRLLCVELCEGNDVVRAKEVAREFLTNFDTYVEAFYYLGLCAYYEDDEEEVHKNFEICIKKKHVLAEDKYEVIREVYQLRREGDEAFASKRLEEAIQLYLKGLQVDSTNIALNSKFHFKIANVKMRQREVGEAIRYLSLALDKKNDYHEAFVLRAECHQSKDKHGKAVEDFEKAYSLNPCKAYKELLIKARERRSIYENAKRSTQSDGGGDESIDPKDENGQKSSTDLHKEKGNKYLKLKRYNDAIKAYSEAIKVNPRDPFYYSNRSICYMMLKNFKEALKDAKSALKIDPSFVKGLLQLGKCHIALGQPEEAIKVLEKARELEPNDNDLAIEFGKAKTLENAIKEGNACMAKRAFSNAEEYFSIAIALGIDCVPLYMKKSECLVFLKDYENAAFVAESTLISKRCNDDSYYLMGLCAYYKGERNKAIDLLKKCLCINPDHRKAVEVITKVKSIYNKMDLGNKAFSEDRFADAFANYSEGLAVDSSNETLNAIFHFNIGLVNIKRNEWKEAIRSLTSAIALNKGYVEAYFMRAECYLRLNELQKAVKDYAELNKISPCPKHKKLFKQTKERAEIESEFASGEKELEIDLAECKKEKGDKYFKEKSYENALKSYSEAIFLNPKCLSYYASRSNCYMMQRNYSDALNDAEEAIGIDSKYLEGYIRSAKCHTTLGNAEEAITAYDKAKELDSESDEIVEGIANSLKLKKCLQEGNNAFIKKQFMRASEQFKVASKIAFANTSLLLKYAECLIRLHLIKELSALIESIPPEMRVSPEVLCIKGIYSYHQDDKDEALKHLNKALELDPSNDETKELIKRIQIIYEKKEKGNESFSKDDLLDALNYFQEGLKVDPDNHLLQAKFHFNIGEVQMKQANFTDAILSFSNAIILKDDYIKALERRAHCYQKTNELEKSIRDYQKLYGLTSSEVHLKAWQGTKRQLKQSLSKTYRETLRSIKNSYKNSTPQYPEDRTMKETDSHRGKE